MSSNRIIVVFGVTGESGSVAKYLLEDGTFFVRAVMRNADNPAAQGVSCLQ